MVDNDCSIGERSFFKRCCLVQTNPSICLITVFGNLLSLCVALYVCKSDNEEFVLIV